jgi:hypothetical protein
VHDTRQQNGIAERLNGTLVGGARAMLGASGLPKFLWDEAVLHKVWLKNRSPTRALVDKTPLEASGGGKPDLSDLHEFGATIYVHVDGKKLDNRGVEAKFVGYDSERKGYRVYWPTKRRVTVERNVRFHPDEVPISGDIQSEGETVDITQRIVLDAPDQAPNDQNPPKTPSAEAEIPQEPGRLPDGLDEPEPNTGRGFRARKALESTGSSMLERSQNRRILLTALAAIGQILSLHLQQVWVTLNEALNGEHGQEWREARDYELSQLEKLKTWDP